MKKVLAYSLKIPFPQFKV